MRKAIACFGLFLAGSIFLTAFAGCGSDGASETTESGSTVPPATSAETEVQIPTEAQPEPTTVQQEPGTEQLTTAARPQAQPITINPSAFSELGMTYGEISQKYGAIIDKGFWNGGYYFEFEKAPHHLYFFEEFSNIGAYTGQKQPEDHDRCNVLYTTAGELFSNFADSADILTVEKDTGIPFEVGENLGTSGNYAYFVYQDFEFRIELGDHTKTILSDMSIVIQSHNRGIA